MGTPSRTVLPLALLGWGALAQANDADPAETAEIAAPTAEAAPPRQIRAPAVRSVAFVDRAPDCDPVEAAYGRCVERVAWLDLGPAWREGDTPSAEDRAQWRNIGELYARIWEDLAVRWGLDEDALQDTWQKAGVRELPRAADLWESTGRGQRRSYALPDPATWLDEARWRTTAAEGSAPWFPNLSVARPSGVPVPAPIARLRGRFATRLAYDGHLHPYDLMDGDATSSGPFHEQMYPFQTALASGDPALQPLRHFVAPEALKREGLDPADPAVAALRAEAWRGTRFASASALDGARDLAIEEFHRFYHLVGTQIVRFALEEYTPTHMRVLSALIAMDVPPGLVAEGVARDVVAASEGQTDDEALIQSLVAEGEAGGLNPEGLDYSQLPDRVVAAWLDRFPEIEAPPPELLAALDRDVTVVLQDILRPGARGPVVLAEEGLQAWVEQAALPGRAPDIGKHVRRLLLRLLVEGLPAEARSEARTRLLLDHVEQEVSARFDPAPSYRVSPQELENSASARWKGVLGRHGFSPHPIADGPGAVAPTAICTTLDRKAALNEPVFGAVDVDLLLVAEDGLKTADELLWATRDQAPWVLVDDPSTARPTVSRLVGLPGGEAIYRARWRLWSGWHLLWGVEPSGAGDERLVLRTGALCEDTVLAPPDLIATLARAALLEGELRANHPIVGLSREERREIEDRERARRGIEQPLRPSADEVVSGSGRTASSASSVKMSVGNSAAAIEEDSGRTAEITRAQASRTGTLVDRRVGLRRVSVTEASDTVAYLQTLMRDPLFGLAREAEAPALALAVFSTRLSPKSERIWRLFPDSPYVRRETRAGAGQRAISAGWLLDLAAREDKQSLTLLAPAYRPTASVSAGAPDPTWRRNRKLEFGLDGGLGALPLRSSVFSCSEDPDVLDEVNALSTVLPCSADAEPVTARTTGLLVDLRAPVTWWFLDEPRVAGEVGPEVQLSLLAPGPGPLWPEGEPNYTWTFSARAGLMAGLRFAPDPQPLVRRGDRSPWGVDHPDGSSDLGRWQAGFRLGGLLGPGFNGLELTGLGELWGAASIRSKRTTAASFTPWHPIVLLGPYVRGQISTVIAGGDEPRYYELSRRTELIVGLRGQIRLSARAGRLPELP